MIDTHAHLQFDAFDADRPEVLGRMRAAGVEACIVVGCDLASSRRAIALAEAHDDVYATVGVHPNDCAGWSDRVLEDIRVLAQHDRVVAIGESGLDFYRDRAPKDVQQRAFDAHAELARAMELPLVVHDRDAHEAIISTLERHAAEGLRAVMHCFSGDELLARRAVDAGLVVSFAGPISYPKNADLRAAAAALPADAYVIETDCPFLAPQARRGKRNEPALVCHVAETVADARGISVDQVRQQSTRTARRLFGLPAGVAEGMKPESA